MNQHRQSSAILILSHHMDEHGVLSVETLARVKKAAELFKQGPFDYLLTSGWHYFDHNPIKVGKAVAQALIDSHGIEENHIMTDVHSRDTVGDAFFIRENIVKPHRIEQLTVVTSNYHIDRAGTIFRRFYHNLSLLNMVATDYIPANLETLVAHEARSKQAFLTTFESIDLADTEAVYATLCERHPFYNGQLHSKLERNDCAELENTSP